MFYTLTLNPALDHVVRLVDLKLGQTNRMKDELIFAGGKGINVSKILRNLGQDSVALGFVAGFTGKELINLVEKENIHSDFVYIDEGFTRINVKIKADKETEINGDGLNIDETQLNKLYSKLEKIKSGDYLFLSGSIPSSLDDDIYENIISKLNNKVNIIVDTVGNALLKTLKYKPFLIKPNKSELEELFDVELYNVDDVSKYAKELQKMGARNIIVSLGGEGAFFLSEKGETKYLSAPKGKVIDTVGSGDSMVAAFVHAKREGLGDLDSFKFSVSAGSATAFSADLATKDEIINIYKNFKEDI